MWGVTVSPPTAVLNQGWEAQGSRKPQLSQSEAWQGERLLRLWGCAGREAAEDLWVSIHLPRDGVGYSSSAGVGICCHREAFLGFRDDQGSMLTLGAIDQSYFVGSLHWVPVTTQEYWQFTVDR